MKFALLGLDAETRAIALEAQSNSRHELAGAYDIPESGRAGLRLPVGGKWEELLSGIADVVIVARGEDEELTAERLRKLVQVGVPAAISHPALSSMLVYYELDMIRQSTNSLMIPLVGDRWRQGVGDLAEILRNPASGLGPLEQVTIERGAKDRSRRETLWRLARDLETIDELFGEMTRVNAMAPGGKEPNFAALGVQLSGPSGVLARWSIGPPSDAEGLRVRVAGIGGDATLWLPDGADGTLVAKHDCAAVAALETRISGRTERREYSSERFAVVALAQIERALASGKSVPDWPTVCRGMELADAVERSVAKGRTIELYYEEHTEQATFKGIMSAVGCLLLCLATLLIMGSILVERVFDLRAFRFLPYLLLGLLGVFLLLQVLQTAFPPSDSARGHQGRDAGPGS